MVATTTSVIRTPLPSAPITNVTGMAKGDVLDALARNHANMRVDDYALSKHLRGELPTGVIDLAICAGGLRGSVILGDGTIEACTSEGMREKNQDGYAVGMIVFNNGLQIRMLSYSDGAGSNAMSHIASGAFLFGVMSKMIEIAFDPGKFGFAEALLETGMHEFGKVVESYPGIDATASTKMIAGRKGSSAHVGDGLNVRFDRGSTPQEFIPREWAEIHRLRTPPHESLAHRVTRSLGGLMCGEVQSDLSRYTMTAGGLWLGTTDGAEAIIGSEKYRRLTPRDPEETGPQSSLEYDTFDELMALLHKRPSGDSLSQFLHDEIKERMPGSSSGDNITVVVLRDPGGSLVDGELVIPDYYLPLNRVGRPEGEASSRRAG